MRSRNRWAVAAAVRQALRRAGKDRREIDRFVREAISAESPEGLQRRLPPLGRAPAPS